ncbi:MAG: hypothetical protein R6U84_08855 [Candidatus Cloacimonadales bacterium]
MQENEQYRMQIGADEKYYKIYIFTPQKMDNFEYRVVTKELKNGKLELIGYNYKIFDGEGIKSQLVQASDIDKDKLPQIIEQLMKLTRTAPEDRREIELGDFADYQQQLQYLEKLPGINEEFLL